jgi:hypothetical protein
MKKQIQSGLFALLSSIFALLTLHGSAQSFSTVKGSGMPVDKNINVAAFNSIDVSGGFDVVLVQGSTEKLILTAQENLFGHIKVEVVQGNLKIFTDRNIMPTKPMKVRVTFKSIDHLEVSGGGDVTCETPIAVPDLGIDISGGGDLRTAVKTGVLDCSISGGGDADINGSMNNFKLHITGGGDIQSEISARVIQCEISGGGDITLKGNEKSSETSLTISGGGDMDVDINTEKLTSSVSGGGNATFRGQTTHLDISINGGGDVQAGSLSANTATIHCSGGSDIHVNVSKELTGQISGGGDLYYSGSPAIVNMDARGGSEIHKQ